jgi:NAD(P)-dependent dehydrogenase (short-subunit alcohol dehydrogenase family)
MRLEGKVALISGAARGIGAAQALLFAREGAKVGIGDIREDEGRGVAAEITAAGGESLFVRLDVTSEQDWAGAVDAVLDRFGRLDILVNNAGIAERATVEDTTADEWDRMMAVNARGVFLGTKAVITYMKSAGGGSIVNISSISGLIGSSWATAYNASKGAVRLLTKSTAIQYAVDGIRANSVHPGPIQTPMILQVFPNAETRESRMSAVPMGRFGNPEEVAYGALYLASDESSYVTGSELVIDGGATAV